MSPGAQLATMEAHPISPKGLAVTTNAVGQTETVLPSKDTIAGGGEEEDNGMPRVSVSRALKQFAAVVAPLKDVVPVGQGVPRIEFTGQ